MLRVYVVLPVLADVLFVLLLAVFLRGRRSKR
jgi:uncharacterized membrane protein YbaN (DUF454 family)